MTDLLDMIGRSLPAIGAALCLTGGLLAIIGTVGVLRFPDVYTRLHAASVTDTSAMTLAIIGMVMMSPDWLVAFKLVAIWTFFFLTGPASSHALANAAHVAGIKPLTGKSLKHETQGDLS